MRPQPPEIKFENGDVSNLQEIKDWITYNVLEYNVMMRHTHYDKKLTAEDKLWLVIRALAAGKEIYIKELMKKSPPILIFNKEQAP